MAEGGYNDPRTITAVIAAAISFIAAALSAYFNYLSRRTSHTSIKIARFNAQQSERARILSWGQEAMDAISAVYILLLMPSTESFLDKRKDCLSKLTSLIDRGRWLLPNLQHTSYGKNKESAYTGFRQAPLDDLVDVYDILFAADSIQECPRIVAKVMKSKRRFASAIQEKLEPRAVEADLKKLGDGIK
ncbi:MULTISPECIES: hypothetical protein [Paracoccus]|uniref:hypothetical protein n=1 Tax=Paracoccus TaxID=265 RepID=UPI001319EB86|nr:MULTISPECIES: hypothetical protein [Paracoccus]MDK8874003.1 hypothetical protein [Paracoccus sp. SSJ]